MGGTFKEQFDLMATHGIFVSPHGAGLMNTMYMPPQSAVIEMFPYHLDHNLYSTMATLMGIASYPIHSINGSIVWANDPVSPPCSHARVVHHAGSVATQTEARGRGATPLCALLSS